MGVLIALFVWWAPVWLTVLIASLAALGMVIGWIVEGFKETGKAEEAP